MYNFEEKICCIVIENNDNPDFQLACCLVAPPPMAKSGTLSQPIQRNIISRGLVALLNNAMLESRGRFLKELGPILKLRPKIKNNRIFKARK